MKGSESPWTEKLGDGSLWFLQRWGQTSSRQLGLGWRGWDREEILPHIPSECSMEGKSLVPPIHSLILQHLLNAH